MGKIREQTDTFSTGCRLRVRPVGPYRGCRKGGPTYPRAQVGQGRKMTKREKFLLNF